MHMHNKFDFFFHLHYNECMKQQNRKAITLLDIAKETGYSRNTVAKALNGGHVLENTKKIIFNAAIKLGYKSFDVLSAPVVDAAEKKVLILSSHFLLNHSFFINFIRGAEDIFKNNNTEFLQYSLNSMNQLKNLTNYLERFQIDGILCLEVLSDEMIGRILALDKPTVFFDFVCNAPPSDKSYDIILADSFLPVRDICSELIEKQGVKTFGFIGDYRHCLGFYNRFAGMREALFLHGLPYDERYSVFREDSLPYNDVSKLKMLLKKMPAMPDCFVCANDYIAIPLLTALKQLKVDVPSRVKVLGFDNVAEAKMIQPTISTVHTDKVYLGAQAAEMLLQRILRPNMKSRTMTVGSKFIRRDST